MSTLLVVFIVGIVIILLVSLVVFFITRSIFAGEESKSPGEVCGLGKSCPEGQVCSGAGKCIKEGTCLVSSDCSSSEVCIGGKECFPRFCTKNENCGPEGFCSGEGICRNRCTSSNDCPGSEGCLNGVCISRRCLIQGDCAPDEACVGVKVPVLGVPPLLSLSQPATSGICRKVLNSCITNLDCSPGLTCSKEKVCIQCTSSADCTGNGICSRGVCLAPTQTPCPSSEILFNPCNTLGAGCPSFPVCCPKSCGGLCKEDASIPTPCPYCVEGKYLCQPSPEVDLNRLCSTDKPCPNGKSCVNGICYDLGGVYGDRCSKDSDCTPSFICSSPRGVQICIPK